MGEPGDLGVLLVHGIGGQRRGDTLLDFGEPLTRSLIDWLGVDAVELDNAELLQPAAGDPAHVRVTVRRGGETRRVLVAESWWADTFHPPGWFELAGWLLWAMPFVVFRATDHRLSLIDTNEKLDDAEARRRWRDLVPVLVYEAVRLVKNVLSAAIVLVLSVVLALLGIVAIIPPIRRALLSAQQVLVRYVGDSYYLLRSPVRGEATISQVERDLAWLERRSVKVAVVAHSQGAEIVRRIVARRTRVRPIASLVTFGSGIAKLRAVERLYGKAWKALAAYLLRILAAVLTVGGPLLAALGELPPLVAVASVFAAAVLMDGARRLLKTIVRDELLAGELARITRGKVARWLDFYATSDPVPEGALPVQRMKLEEASSTRIANRRSPLSDHTSYGANGEAWGPAVLAELAGLVGWTLPKPAWVVVLNARARRARKTRSLVAARYLIGSAAVAAFVLPYFDVWRDRSDEARKWLAENAAWLLDLFYTDAGDWVGKEPGRAILAAAALALAGLLLYAPFAWWWHSRARKRARLLFSPSRPCGVEPVGRSAPFPLSFIYGRIAKHAEKVDRKRGWDAPPRPFSWFIPRLRGGFLLFGLRHKLRALNLYDTPAVDPPRIVKFTPRPTTRRLDGRGTDVDYRDMGAAGTHFGRNGPAFSRHDGPDPGEISRRLLARGDEMIKAGSLNLLAASWVQFEVHDWMQHRPHRHFGPGLPPLVQTDRPRSGAPRFISDQTHWWDASQLYGVHPQFADSLRTGAGRVKDGEELLEAIVQGAALDPAPVPNLWLGLALFHDLFAREHNRICTELEDKEGRFTDDGLFHQARLINSALMAKIHTVEWTPAVIGHPASEHAIRATWWGVLREPIRKYVGRIGPGEVLSGIPGSRTHHDGVRYSLTEEFVAVYRMHPLIPDDVSFRNHANGGDIETFPFRDLTVAGAGYDAVRDKLTAIRHANAFYSLAVSNPGEISLHNYPRFLRELPGGWAGSTIDLGARDIERMREAALPRYNEFRRRLRLAPKESFTELADGDQELGCEIAEVYGNDIESVDLMVGLFAERKPQGFAFSDTAFRIFLLMAARRLRSDRFFTTDFTRQVYTPTGYRWVQHRTIKAMLAEHYPELEPRLKNVRNVFKPWHPTC